MLDEKNTADIDTVATDPPALTVVRELSLQIDRIEGLRSKLETRLAFVLTPEPPTPVRDEPTRQADHPGGSALVNQLAQLVDQASAIADRLAAATHRLEV